MFKVLLISSLMVLPLKAFSACPEIAGDYTCVGAKGNKTALLLTQKNNIEFTMNFGEGPLSFVADDKEIIESKNENGVQSVARSLAKCTNDTVFNLATFVAVSAEEAYSVEIAYAFQKTAEDKLNLNVYLSSKKGKEELAPIRGVATCTKNLAL